jgi:hypothetical protein
MQPSSLLGATATATLVALAFTACGDNVSVPESTSTSSAASSISGCDYSFARPSPSSLVSMGYKFVCRYLSGDPGGGKDLTAAEQSGLEAAGIDIVLNWETTGTDATNGYNAGVSDATSAESEAKSLGQPGNRPIYFSIDFDAQSGDAAAINEYFKGVASVIGLARTGVYGGYYIVNELFNAGLVKWGWQTYAWSNGAWDSRAQLRQTLNGVDNDELDDDTATVADYGQYGPGAPTGNYYAASYVTQSWPLASSTWTLSACQTEASSITLKNTGTLPWTSDTHLGTTQPRDSASKFADSTWLSDNRAAGVTGTVMPGGTFEFKFDFHAPPTPGTYTQYFNLVQDGVAWFSDPGQGGPPDDDIEANITVTGPAGNCAVDPGPPDSGTTKEGDAGKGGDGGGKEDAGGDAATGDHDSGVEPSEAGSNEGDADTPDADSTDAEATGDAASARSGNSGGCSLTPGPNTSSAWAWVVGALVLALGRKRTRSRA